MSKKDFAVAIRIINNADFFFSSLLLRLPTQGLVLMLR